MYAHFLSKKAIADLENLLKASAELYFPELGFDVPIAAQVSVTIYISAENQTC